MALTSFVHRTDQSSQTPVRLRKVSLVLQLGDGKEQACHHNRSPSEDRHQMQWLPKQTGERSKMRTRLMIFGQPSLCNNHQNNMSAPDAYYA